jgi:hypothetical protein
MDPKYCPQCHGTDNYLDLVPLLAKPKELEGVVLSMLDRLAMETDSQHWYQEEGTTGVVVGPQRAHSLIYEVARQLGGTAVVAIPQMTFGIKKTFKSRYPVGTLFESISPNDMGMEITGYNLSLPIPSDATALFVTDKYDVNEMSSLAGCVSNPIRWLPYVLSLVTDTDVHHGPRGQDNMKIISLHEE